MDETIDEFYWNTLASSMKKIKERDNFRESFASCQENFPSSFLFFVIK